uniref:Galectin domain-containing protein n=1 Tax=Aegilops tauschii subsp. strangulata TaxID=200361 RepID=A0A453EXC1_AEGTS
RRWHAGAAAMWSTRREPAAATSASGGGAATGAFPAGSVADLLPSLPGLSGLYPAPANSTAHLSWRLLRPILSRSDAIPGTATGVLEAAAAWRNLTAAVAAAAAAGNNQETGDASCRASVGGDLRARGVKIPCGLAEGAAVTVVGVPKQGAARFQAELVGGGGEVVACFNVGGAAMGAGGGDGSRWEQARGLERGLIAFYF